MNENQVLALWWIIGGIGAWVALTWFLIEICIEKKHLYWRRPADQKDMTHSEWKGYRYRREELEKMRRPKDPEKRGWSEGWNRAQEEWDKTHRDGGP